jgi:hypothetical protein
MADADGVYGVPECCVPDGLWTPCTRCHERTKGYWLEVCEECFFLGFETALFARTQDLAREKSGDSYSLSHGPYGWTVTLGKHPGSQRFHRTIRNAGAPSAK